MSTKLANPIPRGFETLTPYLLVEGVPALIAFLEKTFGVVTVGKLDRPDGSVMHAELEVGDSKLMVGEPMGEFGPMPASIFVYVEDCDAIYARALEAGGTSVMDVTTMQHAGERYGGVKDPSGNIWWIATHLEDVSWEEQQYRIDAVAGQDFKE